MPTKRPPPPVGTIARRIYDFRADESRPKFAKRLGTGVDPMTVYKWETQERVPNADNMAALVRLSGKPEPWWRFGAEAGASPAPAPTWRTSSAADVAWASQQAQLGREARRAFTGVCGSVPALDRPTLLSLATAIGKALDEPTPQDEPDVDPGSSSVIPIDRLRA